MDAVPVRILYLIDEMQALTAGGTERQLLQMITLMKQAGADVRLGTLRGTEWLSAREAGCPVEHFHYRSFWRPGSLAELVRLRRWMRDERIQILQTFFVEANILGPIIGRMAGVSVILGSRRNLNYWMSSGTALLQRFANGFATRLVANCNAVKQFVVASEGVDADKVDVIYNGLDAAHFAPDPELRRTARQKHGFSNTDILIGATTVLRPIKGCETFIDAAKEVARQAPQAQFVLVGDGPLRPALEARAAGLKNRIHFVGAQADIRPFLNMFDIAVLASESEGFSNSILEYLAAGLPTVVTDVGGNPEAIDNAGVVVPVGPPAGLASALLNLLENPAQRATLSQRALARSKDFSLDTTQLKLEKYYRSLLDGV